MVTVSIIVPTFNRAPYLREALASATAQTFQDHEIIVVDDGSTDGTQAMVEQEFRGAPIRYVYQKNGGSAHARNTGIKLARGEFVAFLDSDDLWEPDKLERQLRVFESDRDIGLVFCGSEYLDFQGQTREIRKPKPDERGFVLKKLLFRNFLPTPTVVVRRVWLEQAGLMTEGITFGEDWLYWLKIASRCKVDFVDATLVHFRSVAGGLSDIKASALRSCLLRVLDEIFRDAHLARFARPYQRKLYSHVYFQSGAALLAQGSPAEAVPDFLTSLRWYPFNLGSYRCLVASTLRRVSAQRQRAV